MGRTAEADTTDRPRVSLVSGFLGAGKTTFIRSRLQHPGERTAVLVNEFGTLGFDGELLRRENGIEVLELPGGCVCCNQQFQLEEMVQSICEQFHPQRLFIEPSGVAEPSAILRTLDQPPLAAQVQVDGVITLIDAETFLDDIEPGAFGSFFCDQIRHADLILVNKVDLIDPQQVQEVEERLTELNERALVVTTSFGALPAPLPSRGGEITTTPPSEPPLPWEHCCFEPETPLTRANLHVFGKQLTSGRFGSIVRAKGILPLAEGGVIQFQAVGKRYQLSPCRVLATPRLICIGTALKRQTLHDFFVLPEQKLHVSPQQIIKTL